MLIFQVVADINDKLSANAVAMQLPVGVSEDFNGIIDVLTENGYILKAKWACNVVWSETPAEYKDKIKELRTKSLKLRLK